MNSIIPKTIHYCWLSGDPYPEIIKYCLDSWRERLPDYEIILWDAKRFDINAVKWVQQAAGSKKYAFAADYIRFYALYNFGGIYLDSDVEVIKKFDNLLQNDCFFGYESSGYPEAAIVGCRQGLEWTKIAMSFYEKNNFINSDNSFNQTTAPLVLKQSIESSLGTDFLENKTQQELHNIKIFPCEYFSAKDIRTGKILSTDNTYTIHHFNASWLEEWRRNVQHFSFNYIKTHGNNIRSKTVTVAYHILQIFKHLGICKGFAYCVKKIFIRK